MKRALGLAFKTTSNCASTFSQRYVSSHTQKGGKFAIGLSEAVKRVRRHDCVKVYAYVANCFIAPVSGQKERYAKNFPVTPAWAHKAKTAENKTIKSFFIAIKIFLEFRG